MQLLLNLLGWSLVFFKGAIEYGKCTRYFCSMKHFNLLFYSCLNIDLYCSVAHEEGCVVVVVPMLLNSLYVDEMVSASL